MHPYFEITSSDIRRLNDEQARELVARLCKAELRSKGIGTSPVTWGGDQRAKDGGVDVRVDITPAFGISGYIPKDATAFQVKAEAFPQGKIADEMAPKGGLRPAIVDLSKISGAYVLVSTRDDCSYSAMESRKNAMSDCLKTFGLEGVVHLDFYDSRKIADWVESFPSVVVWLRKVLGKPIESWESYGSWAYRETSIEDEYLLDEKVKVFKPHQDEGTSVIDAINQLRSKLKIERASVRIVGLSGVGKTRLVQALFDTRIVTTEAALDQESVFYTDISNNPSPQPIAMLEALLLEDSDCILIVDNCGQDFHQKLTEITQRPKSKIRLITVEYDIREDEPEGTSCYRLEGSSGEVISQLLKRHYPTLSDLDINKIVEFSDGNARVAFALASTSQERDELSRLTDEALFRRLFVQHNKPDEELLRCAEVASLLYSFDAEDKGKNSELAALSSLAEVSIKKFFRNIKALEARGLVQKRGKWRAVLPHAISNRLASNAVETNPSSRLTKKLVIKASERTARSFSRRLGYLHKSTSAQQIAEEWLKVGGLLGDAAKLNELGRQMLVNIAPVNQQAVLTGLLRSIGSIDFTAFSNPNHRDFTRLLRSLCYESEFFDDAASALLQFTINEPEGNKSDSSRDLLKSLFHCHLSGTHASPNQRASFVRLLVLSDDDKLQKIGLLLLRSALESYHFSSHFGFDFGALKRDYGWFPKDLAEIHNWYGLFIAIAVELSKQSTTLGSDSRYLLGTAFRGLWTNANMVEELTLAADEINAIDGWPDGWIGIRTTLNYDKDKLNPESLAALRLLEQKLAPQDLMSKIQVKILSRGALGCDIEDDSDTSSGISWYEKAKKEAQVLGRAAALDPHALADITLYLSRTKSTDKSWDFGFGVGESALSTQEILSRIRLILATPITEGLNSLFIRGLIAGWHKAHPTEVEHFLENAVNDDIWSAMLPELQIAVDFSEDAYGRLLRCLEQNKTPSWQFNYLGTGRVTDSLTIPQIFSLLSLLAAKPDRGLDIAIHVLSMVTHCAKEKNTEYQEELKSYILNFIGDVDWPSIDFYNSSLNYDLITVIDFGLSEKSLHNNAVESMSKLITYGRSKAYPLSIGDLLTPYFKYYPQEALDACSFEKNDSGYYAAVQLVSALHDRHGGTAISSVSEEELIKWCEHSPEDRCKFAAHTCQLFKTIENSEPSDNSISSIAKSILALAPNKKAVLQIYADRFCPSSWSGSRAAIMREKQQLFDQLNPEGDTEVQTEIEAVKAYLSEGIKKEEQWELEQERSQTNSFE